jgi:hypothetical protein
MSSLVHRLCRRALVLAIVAYVALAAGQTVPAAQSAPKPGQKPAPPRTTSAPKKRVVIDLSGFDLLEPKKVEKQTVVAGATRGMPSAIALAPRLARLYGQQPTLNWRYDSRADRFMVVFRDDAQNEVFRDETAAKSYTYPASAPRLEPSRTYFWTVEVSAPFSLSEPSTPVGFVVLSDAQTGPIREKLLKSADDSYANALARAQLMVDNRLWYDAVATYSDLIGRYPDRPELFEKRAAIYAQLPVTQGLADRDFAHADSLKIQARSK